MRPSASVAVLFLATRAHPALAQRAECPTERHVVLVTPGPNDSIVSLLREKLALDDTTVLLAPDVTADFSKVVDPDPNRNQEPLIRFGRCVTLGSFVPDDGPPAQGDSPATEPRSSRQARSPEPATAAVTRTLPATAVGTDLFPKPPPKPTPSARTPHSLGPELIYGSNEKRADGTVFIDVSCSGFGEDRVDHDGARISGLRLEGPNRNDHQSSETGIKIIGCHDVEVSNMEIAGWGGDAIAVDDSRSACAVSAPGTSVCKIPSAEPAEVLTLIHDNYIHHNQHSTSGGHAAGYGVNLGAGAFARVFRNVFDFNRHSITTSGFVGGYHAERNLILKGGGFHGAWYERDIHVFDVHGTANCPNLPGSVWEWALGGALLGAAIGSGWGPLGALFGGVGGLLVGLGGGFAAQATQSAWNCGDAGLSFVIRENTFQYKKTTDIKIRGTPQGQAIIDQNIFVRSSKNAAIAPTDNDHVSIGPNQYDVETFGQYQVCDLDGDGRDDLFLPTGVTWWFSSAGRFPWSFLKADTTPPGGLRVGYFDGDNRCDVLMERGSAGDWFVSSGGVTDWIPLGGNEHRLHLGHPLREVRFGRFDPSQVDFRPGATRRTTHAFWRRADGQWFVTPMSIPNWQPVASSSFPLADLRFGDFTGDGVTDVLANEGGHWSMSVAAAGQWEPLNPALNDPVKNGNMFIENMDASDNLDDVLRLDREAVSGGQQGVPTDREMTRLIWQRAQNGRAGWVEWKRHVSIYPTDNPDYLQPSFGFVGRFGTKPGGATLDIDANRKGHFFSSAKGAGSEDWESLFWY
jgi:hypothetical protein